MLPSPYSKGLQPLLRISKQDKKTEDTDNQVPKPQDPNKVTQEGQRQTLNAASTRMGTAALLLVQREPSVY